jgi:hypothetical protein
VSKTHVYTIFLTGYPVVFVTFANMKEQSFPHDSELCVLTNTLETADCRVSDSAVYKNANWILQPHAANYSLSDVIRRDSKLRSQRLRLKGKD